MEETARFVDISGNYCHHAAICEDRMTIYSWNFGQLEDPTLQFKHPEMRKLILKLQQRQVKKVVVGWRHLVVLTGEKLEEYSFF